MVGMLMGDEDAFNFISGQSERCQPEGNLSGADPRINQDGRLGLVIFEVKTVARRSRGQRRDFHEKPLEQEIKLIRKFTAGGFAAFVIHSAISFTGTESVLVHQSLQPGAIEGCKGPARPGPVHGRLLGEGGMFT
jgi:hypothetical protein